MCYAQGSIDLVVSVCPMCKVFPHQRCPHTRDVCRNRSAHPRFDVSFLKNAEVETFNGCGYCKWAAKNPPPKAAGNFNMGWPGCCRAPTGASEYALIPAADWRSVNKVHNIPIPADVKATIESVSPRSSPGSPASSARSSTKSSSIASGDRRNSSSGRSGVPPGVTSKGRSSNSSSPKLIASSIVSNSSRGNAGELPEHGLKRREDPDKTRGGSPIRRHTTDVEPSSGTPRRNSSARASSSAAEVDARRNGSQSTSSKVSGSNIRPAGSDLPRKKLDPETSSSSSGSDSLGSYSSESTITSDGGFTDYLSDESEAELQRQAEAKAALLAQNEAEELEFRAARQALANVTLRPPRAWNAAENARMVPSTRG